MTVTPKLSRSNTRPNAQVEEGGKQAERSDWAPWQPSYKVAWYYSNLPVSSGSDRRCSNGGGESPSRGATGPGASRLQPLNIAVKPPSDEENDSPSAASTSGWNGPPSISTPHKQKLSESMESAVPTLIDKPNIPDCGLALWKSDEESGYHLAPGHVGWSNLEYPAVPKGMYLRPINVNEQR